MKIRKLNIKSYRHLENIDFDFTYPEGHAKVGQPLDKICIIGQSATGKTSVLELIKDNLVNLKSTEIINGIWIFLNYGLDFNGSIEYLYKNETLLIEKYRILKGEKEFKSLDGGGSGSVENLIEDGLKVLYFSADVISKDLIDIFNQNPLNLISTLADEKYKWLDMKYILPNYVYEFMQDVKEDIWFSLLYKILQYRKKFTQMASELISKGAIGDINKLNKEYAKWSANNENPLVSFANNFNPILNQLNLEVDLVNTEYPIPIKSKIKDEVIPISGLSTGTKGLMLSMFPLFEIDTTDAMILLDEPERSLFPDMQINLMSYYQNIAPDAQFIVATHSPFIAAAFEPEERFILYFDAQGKVAVRRGESPIGDDPNDMLRNDFNIDYYNEFGKKAYQKYLDLKAKVSQEIEIEKKKKLVVELAELGDKYNF
jgi:AAA ATPase domain